MFASTVKGDGNVSDPIIVTTDEDSKLPKALRYLTINKTLRALGSYNI